LGKNNIQSFINRTKQDNSNNERFALESSSMLEVNLDGRVWTKIGSMIAYNGDIGFDREGMLEGGIKRFLKEKFSGEGMTLSKAEGYGRLYLADSGKKVTILELEHDAITVNGNDVLAFEDSVDWDIKMMKKMSGMLAGGLFNVTLSGYGFIAITTHKTPMTLRVTPEQPVITDPNATVAWSHNLNPDFRTDFSTKSLLGRSNGETVQMEFQGKGFVVVQPYEEVSRPQQQQ
jgi:uncharacterized protein (AIM24 family)